MSAFVSLAAMAAILAALYALMSAPCRKIERETIAHALVLGDRCVR